MTVSEVEASLASGVCSPPSVGASPTHGTGPLPPPEVSLCPPLPAVLGARPWPELGLPPVPAHGQSLLPTPACSPPRPLGVWGSQSCTHGYRIKRPPSAGDGGRGGRKRQVEEARTVFKPNVPWRVPGVGTPHSARMCKKRSSRSVCNDATCIFTLIK